jgi:hypothetical protein
MNFLKFPLEIRNKIYEYLLVKEEAVHISRQRRTGFQKHYFAIFASCKQINTKAHSIFCGNNTFEIDTDCLAGCFIPPKVSEHLKKIKVYVDNKTNLLECLQAIQRCVELRSLSIEMLTVPTYQWSQNPSILAALKFKQLSKLTTIDVKPSSSKESLSKKREVCTMLQNVLKNGYYIPEKKHYTPPEEGYQRSKRVKRQTTSNLDTS